MAVHCILGLGPAGCGKSFYLREQVRQDPRSAILCSTTGVSAIALGCTTINRLLGYFDTRSMLNPENKSWLMWNLTLIAQLFRTLVIDEISMMDALQLDRLYFLVEELNEKLSAREGRQLKGNEKPRNYLKLAAFGDFCQLSPVNGEFAFKAKCWDEFMKHRISFPINYRQKDDPAMAEAMKHLRRGDGVSALPYLREFCTCTDEVDQNFNGATIFPCNRSCDEFNTNMLGKLPGDSRFYPAIRNGLAEDGDLNTPDLYLKVGARVMVLANSPKCEGESFRYVNGDQGIVTELKSDSICIQLDRNGDEIELERVKRDHEVLRVPKDVKEIAQTTKGLHVVGKTEQFPIRLGYANTIWKMQGQTLDSFQVDIRHPWAAQPAAVYVALSRIRSGGKITIVGGEETLIQRCKTHPEVTPYL